jgi:hypothetical protein
MVQNHIGCRQIPVNDAGLMYSSDNCTHRVENLIDFRLRSGWVIDIVL